MAFLLHHLLTESAARHPDREALVFRDEAISYAGLEAESNRLAHCLAEDGAGRDRRIGIYMNRSIASVTAAFGVLKAGATYVPLDPLCPPGRLRYIVEKCGIGCLLTTRDKLRSIGEALPPESPVGTIMVMDGLDGGGGYGGPAKLRDWPKLREGAQSVAPCVPAIESDVAYILFTSGSTGSPKGVMLSHLNALTFVNAAHALFGIRPEDRLSNICPLHFDMSVFDLFVAMKAGAAVVIIPETAATFPAVLAELIAKSRITVWNSVPSALSLLAAYNGLERHDLSRLRLVVFAGERFPLKYLKRLKEAVPEARFCNMYGQTEANSSTCYWIERLPAQESDALPIGKALPNFEVFALDEEGKRVTVPGREGELFVRASTVALGYWGEPEKTERAFVRNPLKPGLPERVYRTGDLVSLDGDGNYVFRGRKDHLIKSRGYRIEIGEIEAVLRGHREVKNAVVIPLPDELVGNRIWAIVVPSAAGSVTKEELARYCAQQLPKYMIPESFEFREELPTTSSGKVDRQMLRGLRGNLSQSG